MDKANNDKGEIIIFPSYDKLKKEIAKLRTELCMLTSKKDALIFVECENIRMAYMLALGSIEYKAYKLECKVLRLKRKIELIQANINRQEKVELNKIEEILDLEFNEYLKILNQKINAMNKALERSQGKALSKEDSKLLKKLYYNIVKALHPDLHPNQSEANMKLFHNAITAYENGDINAIKIIAEIIGSLDLYDEIDSLNQMIKEKERLIALIKTLNEEIEKIKNCEPYTLKELIKDEKIMQNNKEKIEKHIKNLTQTVKIYENKILEMLR